MAGRKKAFKVAGACALAVLAAMVVMLAGGYVDLGGHLATGHKTYKPDGPTAGRAIIVYSPGLSWQTNGAVSHVAGLLADRGYEVDAAGVSSGLAQNLSGYDLVLVGSPNYGARPSGCIGAFIEGMQPDRDAVIGVLCTSAGVTTKGADAMTARIEGRGKTVKAKMALAMTEQVDPAAAEFVSGLLRK